MRGSSSKQIRLYPGKDILLRIVIEIFFDLEPVGPTSALCRSPQCRSASGARVDNDISLVAEQFDQPFEQRYGLLRRMDLRCISISHLVEAVEYHPPAIVELRKTVAVEDQSVFAVADYFHVGLQNLRGEILAEHERDIAFQPVALPQFDVIVHLFERAEKDHARRTAFPLALSLVFFIFDGFILAQHLRTEVHELRGPEIPVRIEKLLPGQRTLAVAIIPVDIPGRIARVGIRSEVIRDIGDNELRLGDAVRLEILKVVVK